jgi:hypothetical protein
MTGAELGEEYFRALCDRVRPERILGDGHSFLLVCERMNLVPFDWSVPNDDNRADDGKELRRQFLRAAGSRARYADLEALMRPEASVLEVLVALSARADYMAEIGVSNWFSIMLKNLGLDEYAESNRPTDTFKIRQIIRRFNDRQYSPKGKGGLFPLKNPLRDQRRVELWYQLSAYIAENNLV